MLMRSVSHHLKAALIAALYITLPRSGMHSFVTEGTANQTAVGQFLRTNRTRCFEALVLHVCCVSQPTSSQFHPSHCSNKREGGCRFLFQFWLVSKGNYTFSSKHTQALCFVAVSQHICLFKWSKMGLIVAGYVISDFKGWPQVIGRIYNMQFNVLWHQVLFALNTLISQHAASPCLYVFSWSTDHMVRQRGAYIYSPHAASPVVLIYWMTLLLWHEWTFSTHLQFVSFVGAGYSFYTFIYTCEQTEEYASLGFV